LYGDTLQKDGQTDMGKQDRLWVWKQNRNYAKKYLELTGVSNQWRRRRGAGGARASPKVFMWWKSGQNPVKSE